MTPEKLRERSMTLAVEVFKFARPLFGSSETRGVAAQLVASATSIAANYRAAVHARSPKEWRAKLGLVLEESDETVFWLHFIRRALPHLDADAKLAQLTDEAEQLTRIFGATLRTAKRNAIARKALALCLMLGFLALSFF